MSHRASGCGAARMLAAAAALSLVACATGWLADASDASTRCVAGGYSYSGVQDARAAHGIRATLVEVAAPTVAAGHVAAWVGVGGPGQGAGGRDAWIQIGLNALADGVSRLYFEFDAPGLGPTYRQLAVDIPVGARYEVGVLELSARPGWWQVWLDGKPASAPVSLPGSSNWRPMALAESWAGRRQECNEFAYRFEHVTVALGTRGAWSPLVAGYRFHNPASHMHGEPGRTFVVSTTSRPPPVTRLAVRQREGIGGP